MPDHRLIEGLMEAIAPVILGAMAPMLRRIEALEARPVEGRPGADGKDGTPGNAGPIGPAGKDFDPAAMSVAIVDEVAKAVAALPPPVAGRDGRDGLPGVPGAPGEKGIDGKDGGGFESWLVEYDGERSFTFKCGAGDNLKHFTFAMPIPLYRDVWQPKGYAKSDIVTSSNESWIAITDNSDKPPSASWRLMARKGRDGKDGNRPPPDPGPVKLR
jgi:hypothetical protein